MAEFPTHTPVPKHIAARSRNPYEGRWRWWYAAIADWMLENPGGSMIDCAHAIGRGVGTVQQISASNTFKDYYAARRAEWE